MVSCGAGLRYLWDTKEDRIRIGREEREKGGERASAGIAIVFVNIDAKR